MIDPVMDMAIGKQFPAQATLTHRETGRVITGDAQRRASDEPVVITADGKRLYWIVWDQEWDITPA